MTSRDGVAEVAVDAAEGGMKALPKLEGEYCDDVEEARRTFVLGDVGC